MTMLSRQRALTGTLLGLLASPALQAAGFNLPEISIGGLGAANAVSANTEMLGAVPYNPSLAVFHEGTTLSGGLMLVRADSQVTTAAPNTVTTASFQGKDNAFIPNLSLTHQIGDDLTLAFNTTVPFGLSTQYPAGTFSVLGTNSPTKSQVEIIDFSPSLAFRVAPGTSLAVGVDYYWVRKIAFDAAAIQNKGDGTAWGWNLSASHVSGPWSFGASFRSHAQADISGSTTIPGLGTFAGTRAELDIPWRAQIGVRYRISPELAVEGDISRTGWSSFDVLTIRTTSPAGTITSTNRWKDSNAYRLAATWQLDGRTELRFGYSFDETAMPTTYFSARTADADRHLFSIGVEREMGDGLAIEAGYMYVKFADRSLRSLAAPVPGDPNGSPAYNGDYSTSVHLFGIGLSKRF